MYRIEKTDTHLVVQFEDTFDYPVLQTVIHHITSMPEYPETNDLWIVGNHHADIHLGELEPMMKDFQCRCPRESNRRKTAIVVEPGMTAAIIELWVRATNKRVPFEIRIFATQSEAEAWLAEAEVMSA